MRQLTTASDVVARLQPRRPDRDHARAGARYRGEVGAADPVVEATFRAHSTDRLPNYRDHFKPAAAIAHGSSTPCWRRDPATVVHQCGSGVRC